jgi:hypothetical protein
MAMVTPPAPALRRSWMNLVRRSTVSAGRTVSPSWTVRAASTAFLFFPNGLMPPISFV